MHIGVVADTHLPRFGRALPRALVDGLRAAEVELILHLGDFTQAFVPALFDGIARLDGVAGNNDPPALVERFGRRKVLEIGAVRLGLTHGDLGAGRTTPERARRAFLDEPLDAVLFGHSHVPWIERSADGPLLLNPGSPTDKRRQPRYTWALLRLTPDGPDAEIRSFDDRAT